MARRGTPWVLVAALALGLARTSNALAQETLVAGPGQGGHDAALEQKMEGLHRQIHALLSVEIGWGLEANVSDAQNRDIIADFIASGSTDFEAQTGLHPYEVVDRYDEYGDLGMFGGVQIAGDIFRYVVLRDSGAPASVLDPARAELVRGLRGLHWYHQVTGVPGVVARGIRRAVPEAGDPPLPEALPPTVPLFDANGDPQPADKKATWRADNSGELPFLIWLDDSSKDQLDGWVFAIGVAWDLLGDDPAIPKDALDDLKADALAVGRALMQRRAIGSFETDLVMMDADGRPTTFHDLSAEEIAPGVVFNAPTNGFNAWMSLGIVRTLFHITGDAELGRFYYESLIEERDYLGVAEQSVGLMYVGNQTNFSNVNMAFVAAWGILRHETDPSIAERARVIFEEQLYAPGKPRQAKGTKQTFFDFLFAGFRRFGVLTEGGAALADGLETLTEHAPAPYFTFGVDNCDAAEQQSLSCVGVDGTPIQLSPEPGRGGGLVAVDPVPMRIRPPSNFEWRSDPFRVNGGEGDRLNPAGEIVCAYWMGRYLEKSAAPDGMGNVSPRALPRPASSTPDGGAAGSGASEDESSGCGCRIERSNGTRATNGTRAADGASWGALLSLLALLTRRKRTRSARN